MPEKREIKAVISGSFQRAKEKIDEVNDFFTYNGIEILSPPKGGLYLPRRDTLWAPGSYPLLNELDISEQEAKSRHILEIIRRANFLYVVAPEGYIGEHVALEIGFALGRIPVYRVSRESRH